MTAIDRLCLALDAAEDRIVERLQREVVGPLEAERDALQKRVEALEILLRRSTALNARNEACAKWVREHGAVALASLEEHPKCTFNWPSHIDAHDALRALLEKTP